MEQGPTEQRILEQCARYKKPYPKSIRDAPLLLTGLDLYYRAFQSLSTGRMESGFIPWSAVQEYCHWHELSIEQTEDMHYLLMRMDTVRNEHLDKQAKKK